MSEEDNSFDEYFENNKTEVFRKIKKVYEENKDKIKVKIFLITPMLLKIIENDLTNPPDKPKLKDIFKQFLINNLILYEDVYNKHSPLHYSTPDGINSFHYASPEIYKSTFYQLITTYIWCKHFIEYEGYSGVLPNVDLLI
jgi:hypothetical protein